MMLTVKDVSLVNKAYGEGFACSVTFQIGDYIYNKVSVDLPPHATRGVVELAIAEAKAMLSVETGEITIAGEPKIVPLVEASDAEFAEVEAPAPALITDAEADALPAAGDSALEDKVMF